MTINVRDPMFVQSKYRYPILQSGFISFDEEGLTKPSLMNPTIHDDILMKEYRTLADKFFYSKGITELFHRWRSNPSIIREFDFRESVLKMSFKLFKTNMITKWIALQNEKPTLSNIHTVFLLESLKFAAGIAPRSLENVQWISLIDYSDKAEGVRVDMGDYFSNQNGAGQSNDRIRANMNEFIQDWVSQINGFEDMLITLYVIFGDREQKTDVVINP